MKVITNSQIELHTDIRKIIARLRDTKHYLKLSIENNDKYWTVTGHNEAVYLSNQLSGLLSIRKQIRDLKI